MPDIGSFDFFMRLIWQATLLLVAIGLLLMTGLVLHRLFQEWREKRFQPRREALRRQLLASFNAPVPTATEEAPTAITAGLPLAETARLVDELAQIVRGEAKRRLAAFAAGVGVERYWLKRLGSRLAPFRQQAARCLALLDTDRTRSALTACLADRDDRLRLAAAEALAHHPSRASALLKDLIDDPAASSRHATRVWHLLAAVAPDALVENLEAASGKPKLLCRILEALADAGHVSAAGQFEQLVGRQGELVDRTVLAALLKLQHPAMLRVARRLAKATELETRRAAMAILKDRARPEDTDLLRSLASDRGTDIGATAELILQRLAGKAATGASLA